MQKGSREKEEQKSADADEGRVRVRARKNGTIGAITGRIKRQLRRREHRGKNDPAEEQKRCGESKGEERKSR